MAFSVRKVQGVFLAFCLIPTRYLHTHASLLLIGITRGEKKDSIVGLIRVQKTNFVLHRITLHHIKSNVCFPHSRAHLLTMNAIHVKPSMGRRRRRAASQHLVFDHSKIAQAESTTATPTSSPVWNIGYLDLVATSSPSTTTLVPIAPVPAPASAASGVPIPTPAPIEGGSGVAPTMSPTTQIPTAWLAEAPTEAPVSHLIPELIWEAEQNDEVTDPQASIISSNDNDNNLDTLAYTIFGIGGFLLISSLLVLLFLLQRIRKRATRRVGQLSAVEAAPERLMVNRHPHQLPQEQARIAMPPVQESTRNNITNARPFSVVAILDGHSEISSFGMASLQQSSQPKDPADTAAVTTPPSLLQRQRPSELYLSETQSVTMSSLQNPSSHNVSVSEHPSSHGGLQDHASDASEGGDIFADTDSEGFMIV